MLPKRFALVLCVHFLSLAAHSQSILVCTFEKTALVERTSSGSLQSKPASGESLRIVFSGLDGKHPVMKGNLGESDLEIVERLDHDVIWLIERPPLAINLFTIFPKSRVAIMSKQYLMIPDRPFGLVSIANCD